MYVCGVGVCVWKGCVGGVWGVCVCVMCMYSYAFGNALRYEGENFHGSGDWPTKF